MTGYSFDSNPDFTVCKYSKKCNSDLLKRFQSFNAMLGMLIIFSIPIDFHESIFLLSQFKWIRKFGNEGKWFFFLSYYIWISIPSISRSKSSSSPYFENHANIPWRVFFFDGTKILGIWAYKVYHYIILADAILVNPCPSLYKSAVSLFITTEK